MLYKVLITRINTWSIHMDSLENLTDEECVQMCLGCLATGVAIPCVVERRVKELGIWRLLVGAANDAFRYESDDS